MDWLAVGAAGFLGAVTRAFLSWLIGSGQAGQFPFGTLIINLTGCFILSFFLTVTLSRPNFNHRLRLAISAGFLGAYTTFSSFALETINLLKSGLPVSAVAYVLLTSAGCTALAWTGQTLGRLLIGAGRSPEGDADTCTEK